MQCKYYKMHFSYKYGHCHLLMQCYFIRRNEYLHWLESLDTCIKRLKSHSLNACIERLESHRMAGIGPLWSRSMQAFTLFEVIQCLHWTTVMSSNTGITVNSGNWVFFNECLLIAEKWYKVSTPMFGLWFFFISSTPLHQSK